MRRALFIVFMLFTATAGAVENYATGGSRGGGGTPGVLPVPIVLLSQVDWDSEFAITADLGCCSSSSCVLDSGSTYQRWTPSALGSASGPYSFASYEASALPTFPLLTTAVSSSCLDLTVGDGRHTNENVNAWLQAVDAGGADPDGYHEIRYDIVTREILLARHPELPAFNPRWILRTDRTWADFVGFFDLNPMRAADQTRCGATGATCDWSNRRNYGEAFDGAIVWDVSDGSEEGHTLYDLLARMEPGLEETAVYRFFSRGGDAQQMYGPVGVIADVSDPDYQDWLVTYYRLVLEQRPLARGLSLIHKLNFFRQDDGDAGLHHVDVGDGLGGMSSEDCDGATGTADTLAELQGCDDADSGPKEDANGNPYLYADEVEGMVGLARKLNTAGIPYLMRAANAYWWIGCTTLNADWTGTGCTNTYGATQAPLLREFASRAEALNIDRQGKPADGSSGGLGSGSGSGFSCASLEALILSASGGIVPTTVTCIDSQAPLRTAPIVQGLAESNPEILSPLAAPSSTVTVNMVADPVQGPTPVAPAVVHVDLTSSTDSTPSARPYHDWQCAVDCGIERAGFTPGTWATTGASYDFPPEALIAGCYYEQPGSYTIKAFCMDPSGDTDTAEAAIVVADGDDEFPTTATHCVSRDGVFTGGWCPAGALQTTNAGGDFDAALATVGVSTKKRIIFKGGEAWSMGTAVTLGASSADPGLLTSAGGARPVVTLSGGVGLPQLRAGWTMANLDFAQSLNTNAGDLAFLVDEPNVTFAEIEFTAADSGCVSIPTGGSTHPDLLALVNFRCRPLPGSSPTTSPERTAIFLRQRRGLLMGVDVDSERLYSYVRWVYYDRVAVTDSYFADSESGRNVIQIRGPSAAVGAIESGVDAGQMVFARNIVRQSEHGAGWLIRICPENQCDNAPDADGATDVADVLLDGNLLTIEAGGGTLPTFGNGLIGNSGVRDVTIRNNVFDLQGMDTAGTAIDHIMNPSEPLLAIGRQPFRMQVYGNTVYRDDATGRGFRACQNTTTATGHRCENNLIDVPNSTGTVQATNGSGFDATTGNVLNTSAASSAAFYVGAVPGQGLTSLEDFDLATGASPRDESAGVVDGLLRDALNRARGPSAAAGALEGW